MAYSWENDKRTPRRTPFEWTLKGYIRNDPRISHFLRLRTLVASGIFWILFFAVEKEYLVRRDSRQNHQRTPRGTMARRVLLNFYTELKHALALTAIPRGDCPTKLKE